MPTDADPRQRMSLRERLAKLIAGGAAAARERQHPPATPSAIRSRVKLFETASVRDVMTSRVDIAAVDVSSTLGDVLNLFAVEAHSRMPVYRDSIDEPLGFVHIKDVVAEVVRSGWTPDTLASRPLERLVRDLMFVPESTRLPDLLVQMQASRIHIALVVDEYGGTGGMVCLEDLVEQIVGDIEDEYDFDEAEDNIVQEKRGVHRVKALTEIADFNAAFGTSFSDTEFDTIGGLVLNRFGRVPKRGEQLLIDQLNFRVLRADSRRIYLLQVAKKIDKPAE